MAIRRKICLLGAPGVGKTSLVRRFVSETFSDEYLTTLGVKIERRNLEVDGTELSLLVWDVHGEEGSLSVKPAFLRGAAGFILVVDGTRPETAQPAVDLAVRMSEGGDNPAIVVATNKADLVSDWSEVDAVLATSPISAPLVRTSAASGDGVEITFETLGRKLLES